MEGVWWDKRGYFVFSSLWNLTLMLYAIIYTHTHRIQWCLTEFDRARVPGHCPNILQEAQAWLVSARIVYPSPATPACVSVSSDWMSACVCVCVFWCLVSELQVIKNRRWRGVQEERKKQEIKDEGHFIGLITLGVTVTKSRIKGEEMGKLRKKVSNTAMYVLNRSVLLCLEVTYA